MEAEPLYKRAHEIVEKVVGRDHLAVGNILNNRAELLDSQVNPLLAESTSVHGFSLGWTPRGNTSLLADMHSNCGEAEVLYRRPHAMQQKVLVRVSAQLRMIVSLNNRLGLW